MTERQVQLAIFRRFQSGTLIPNWTPPKWWECDVARIMPSGRWHEYEIKLTKADFLNDAKKFKKEGRWLEQHSRGKHLSLALADPECPNCFWYVMPREVAETVEIPHWAGLVTVNEHEGRIHLHQKKKAPLIHKAEFTFSVPEKNVFYWRMWTGIEKLVREKRKVAA